MKKIAVIGAGISGLSIAQMLKSTFEVEVYEAGDRPGGLVSCDRIDDVLFHKVGGHVFNSKNQQVLDWFWSFFDKNSEFVSAKRNAKIYFEGQLIGYPIENYLYQLDESKADIILKELKSKSVSKYLNPLDYPNFESFLKDNFGEYLYQLYFRPYNQKIWNRSLDQIPMRWLEGKLPMPDVNQILLSYENKIEESSMVHSSFYYPKYGGSQFIADRLSSNIPILYNSKVDSIVKLDTGYSINNRLYDYIVFTGNLVKSASNLYSTLIPPHLIDQINTLKFNSTSNYLCWCDKNDLSWLYIPEEKFKAHRIIFTGNFSPSNTPFNETKSSCVVEFSGKVSDQEMMNEIAKLPFNLIPISYNYTDSSYVIQQNDTRDLIREVNEILNKHNIYLLGRFAEWEYYNMDKAIEAAMMLCRKLNSKI